MPDTHNGNGEGTIRQQIGEILGTVRSLQLQLDDRQRNARESEDRIQAEIRTIKHDARNSEFIVSGRMELAAKDIRTVEAQQHEIHAKLDGVERSVRDMEKPLAELTRIRRRLAALGSLAAAMLGTLWILSEPAIRVIIEHWIK